MNEQDYISYIQQTLGVREILTPLNSNEIAWSLITEYNNRFISEKAINSQINISTNFETTPLNEFNSSSPSDLSASEKNIETSQANTNELKKSQSHSFFLRIMDASMVSLNADPIAWELFTKLRQALGLDAETAPWVEVYDLNIIHLDEVLQSLNVKDQRVLLMRGSDLQRPNPLNGKLNSLSDFWIIPDPSVLIHQLELKRPTWELLKAWNQISIK